MNKGIWYAIGAYACLAWIVLQPTGDLSEAVNKKGLTG
jgi:hypothetical protein